jgi:DNA repair exonuclease SbcCD ATPase subunit
VVSALVSSARQLAQAEEPGIKLPLGEVEATLSAALAEPDVAAQVRTGRLIRSASYAGFGEVPRPRLRLVTDDTDVEDEEAGAEEDAEAEVIELPNAARETAPRERERLAAERRRREYEQRRRDLRRELGVAEADEKRADRQVEKATTAERDAEHLVEDLDAELAELERRRTEAQADVARRKLARRTAEREAAAPRRRVGDVQAAQEDLEASMPD